MNAWIDYLAERAFVIARSAYDQVRALKARPRPDARYLLLAPTRRAVSPTWSELAEVERNVWRRIVLEVVERHEGVGINDLANPPTREG